MNNLFSFHKNKEKKQSAYVIHQSSTKQYWRRFFGNKLNLTWFILFTILILSLIIALFFIRNSPTKSIDENTALVNNLPSSLNKIIIKDFNRGPELDFIRQIASSEAKMAIAKNREPLFLIYFDSAKHIGGDQTIHTDIVTLIYNPYDLIKAVNNINSEGLKISIPSILYLGTNNQGIDIYSRSIVTLWITIITIFFAIFINIFIGFNLAVIVNISKKNHFINFIDKLINSMSVIPEIIWVFLLSVFIGTKWYAILISLSLICWISYYKLAKEKIWNLLHTEFILASKAIGSSYWQIAYKHMFRYLFADFLIILIERFSMNILIVSSLAFLDFITETNNLNMGSILKEAIILFFENPGYLLLNSIYLILFSLTLKLLSLSFANTLNVKNK
ncbi:peptide ABC transporter permease [Metamycoplasma auris]|uniref:Peptide/nickel transport system permease protein n=1 Tax=Metamycoplasma auris TaxID=51363 RepID=A0A2W7GUM0_9BACT|nr:peptide ABC transporter permease [Metamycoplasma auris]PZW01443.1 peptide/nickel transport system permease protein [Metamycoplasma auris]